MEQRNQNRYILHSKYPREAWCKKTDRDYGSGQTCSYVIITSTANYKQLCHCLENQQGYYLRNINKRNAHAVNHLRTINQFLKLVYLRQYNILILIVYWLLFTYILFRILTVGTLQALLFTW